MKIAVYGQAYSKDATENVSTILFDFLKKLNHKIYVEQQFFSTINTIRSLNINFNTFKKLDKTFDLLISIGGDGTILRAATHVADLEIPIVGINTGRLGFLATIKTEDIEEALKQIFKENFTISNRTLLTVKTQPSSRFKNTINFALNEVAISRKNTTSMIKVETYLNNEYLTSYWSDGLIISTPTGSTGYSLSCGGPVIAPESKNFVITPIAPHNLNARPLVIPDSTTINLKVEGREDHFLLSLDSRIVTLPNDTKVTIEKADFVIKMVQLQNETFLDTLRRKLLWGEDLRN